MMPGCPATAVARSSILARLGLAAEYRDLMPDPPRRLTLVREDSRHEAALSETTEARVDPELERGLPLFRARSAFVEPKLWKAALAASVHRANPAWKIGFPGSKWRYERFVPWLEAPGEQWEKWDQQEADPLLRAEADRQATFLRVSMALGQHLMVGNLEGSGRLGSMVGPWTPIPAAAWEVLQAPCATPAATDLSAWRHGHLVGPGMEFWGVRILDTTGLSLRAAALAYGPAEAAAIAQHGMVFGHLRPSLPPTPKSLAARMAAAAIPQVGPATKPDAAELADAVRSLRQSLVRQLQDGSLIADGEGASRLRRPIEARLWATGRADFSVSALVSGASRFVAIRIRQPLQPSNAADGGRVAAVQCLPVSRKFNEAEVAAWFGHRVQQYLDAPRHPPEDADQAAANTEFGRKVPRKWIRFLRDKHVPANRRPQGRVKK